MDTQKTPLWNPQDSWQKQLSEGLQVPYFLPYQELVIFHLLQALCLISGPEDKHTNLMALFPTGMGKTLCFMGPIFILKGYSIVIYPLNALLNDQERRFHKLGIPCGVLKGGQTKEERETLKTLLLKKQRGVFLTNPETLVSESMVDFWNCFNFDFIVIDEVHLVIEWGKSFRPQFLELSAFRKKHKIPVLTAFSATVPQKTITDLEGILFDHEQPFIIQAPMDRANLEFSVIPTTRAELFAPWWFTPWSQVFGFTPLELPAIFFTRTRSEAEKIRKQLQLFFRRIKITVGISTVHEKDILFYHGGLSKNQRNALEQAFFTSNSGIMVATCAYGTGIDKSNIRTVVHLSPPENPENYIQESGRAGRDGASAKALLFFNPEEISNTWVEEYTKPGRCRREWLTHYLGDTLDGCSGCDSCLQREFSLRLEDMMVVKVKQNRKIRSSLINLKKEILVTVTKETQKQWARNAKARGLSLSVDLF